MQLPDNAKPLLIGPPNRYYATPDGGIWSVTRGLCGPKGRICHHWSPGVRIYERARRLKTYQNGTRINLQHAINETCSYSVPRLILTVFDRFPHGGEVAYHKNGDISDNCIYNLKWTTRRAILTGTADVE